mmetsp:Transcript_15813/g.38975  ORF Transcript_15813/g.38975 Transcript_15813/m.38975 type:complete len:770 (+) Transcript_15813:311-2620(+)
MIAQAMLNFAGSVQLARRPRPRLILALTIALACLALASLDGETAAVTAARSRRRPKGRGVARRSSPPLPRPDRPRRRRLHQPAGVADDVEAKGNSEEVGVGSGSAIPLEFSGDEDEDEDEDKGEEEEDEGRAGMEMLDNNSDGIEDDDYDDNSQGSADPLKRFMDSDTSEPLYEHLPKPKKRRRKTLNVKRDRSKRAVRSGGALMSRLFGQTGADQDEDENVQARSSDIDRLLNSTNGGHVRLVPRRQQQQQQMQQQQMQQQQMQQQQGDQSQIVPQLPSGGDEIIDEEEEMIYDDCDERDWMDPDDKYREALLSGDLPPGSKIEVKGLTVQQSYNKLHGRVLGFDPELGRYDVRMLVPRRLHADKLLLKPKNIIVIKPNNESRPFVLRRIVVTSRPFGFSFNPSNTKSLELQKTTGLARAKHLRKGDQLIAIDGRKADAQGWHNQFSSANLPFEIIVRTHRNMLNLRGSEAEDTDELLADRLAAEANGEDDLGVAMSVDDDDADDADDDDAGDDDEEDDDDDGDDNGDDEKGSEIKDEDQDEVACREEPSKLKVPRHMYKTTPLPKFGPSLPPVTNLELREALEALALSTTMGSWKSDRFPAFATRKMKKTFIGWFQHAKLFYNKKKVEMEEQGLDTSNLSIVYPTGSRDLKDGNEDEEPVKPFTLEEARAYIRTQELLEANTTVGDVGHVELNGDTRQQRLALRVRPKEPAIIMPERNEPERRMAMAIGEERHYLPSPRIGPLQALRSRYERKLAIVEEEAATHRFW